ncbi:MAG: hypothetical protein VB049_11745 [Candidatus Pelethousia sp.]|nr:hypothetical protein [Candidatus Pelethousia sp.]
MALYMPKTTKEGFEVNYWVIQSIEIDREKETATIKIVPYASQAAYQTGRRPIESERVIVRAKDIVYPSAEYGDTMTHYTDYFSTDALAAAGKDVYAVAYGYIKQYEGAFADAADI